MTDSTQAAPEAVKVEVQTSALLRLIAEAQPFADPGDMIPMLNSVIFEFAGADLLALATDRYMLGVSRLPVGAEHVAGPLLLPLSEVKRLVSLFKPAKGTDPMLAVTFGAEALTVQTTATLDGVASLSAAFGWSEKVGSVLNWRAILATADGVSEDLSRADFNPTFLARFAAVKRHDGEAMTVWPTANNKPWRITVGDHFVGLIMPMRRTDGAQDWSPAARNEQAVEPVKKPRAARTRKAAA